MASFQPLELEPSFECPEVPRSIGCGIRTKSPVRNGFLNLTLHPSEPFLFRDLFKLRAQTVTCWDEPKNACGLGVHLFIGLANAILLL
jgi:hypothetical protein